MTVVRSPCRTRYYSAEQLSNIATRQLLGRVVAHDPHLALETLPSMTGMGAFLPACHHRRFVHPFRQLANGGFWELAKAAATTGMARRADDIGATVVAHQTTFTSNSSAMAESKSRCHAMPPPDP